MQDLSNDNRTILMMNIVAVGDVCALLWMC